MTPLQVIQNKINSLEERIQAMHKRILSDLEFKNYVAALDKHQIVQGWITAQGILETVYLEIRANENQS